MKVSYSSYLKDSSIKITFYNIFLKYSIKTERNIYLSHIAFEQKVPLSGIRHIFKASEASVKTLAQNDLNINKDNSIIFLVIEFKAGIRFTPDINFIRKILKSRDKIEEFYDVQLGGVIFIIKPELSVKGIETLMKLIMSFKVKYKIKEVSSFKEALILIEKLSNLKITKVKNYEGIMSDL